VRGGDQQERFMLYWVSYQWVLAGLLGPCEWRNTSSTCRLLRNIASMEWTSWNWENNNRWGPSSRSGYVDFTNGIGDGLTQWSMTRRRWIIHLGKLGHIQWCYLIFTHIGRLLS
jgi:hypothetical protein